jgi:hypothetical protein
MENSLSERDEFVKEAKETSLLWLFDQVLNGSFMPGVDDVILRERIVKLLKERRTK